MSCADHACMNRAVQVMQQLDLPNVCIDMQGKCALLPTKTCKLFAVANKAA